MEDRYLFRAMRDDGKGWLEGFLFANKHGKHYILPYEYYGSTSLTSCMYVDPVTIGQCIGLKDKHGVLVFEGDVLRVMFDDCEFAGVVRYGETYMSRCTFYVDTGSGVRLLHQHNKNHIEIIGNIYDNPELLQEEA